MRGGMLGREGEAWSPTALEGERMGVEEGSSVGRGEGIALPLPVFWFGVDMFEA